MDGTILKLATKDEKQKTFNCFINKIKFEKYKRKMQKKDDHDNI